MAKGRRDRGAAVVEFAILLPLILLVIAGIVDFGRMFFVQVQITNAAREGVRAAAISTASAGGVQTRAQASAPTLTLTTTATLCPGVNASVTVTNDFTWFLMGPALSLFGGAGTLPNQLTSTAVMKCGG